MNSALDSNAHETTESSSVPPSRGTADEQVLRAVVALQHPHLVRTHALEGVHGFEPDLANGQTLAELCKRRYGSRPIPLRFGLRIVLDMLSGLAALHDVRGGGPLGFAHGEIAPLNIVVGRDGISRLVPVVRAHWDDAPSSGREVTGYAAPEKLRGDPYDQRADIFSTGVLLWEMITGRFFRGLPPEVVTAWVVDGKVPDPVQPEDAPWVVALAGVATRALAIDPDARWPHIGIMGAQIENIATGHIATAAEVAALFGDASDTAPAGSSEPSWTPSLSPTAVSIPPPSVPSAAIPRSMRTPLLQLQPSRIVTPPPSVHPEPPASERMPAAPPPAPPPQPRLEMVPAPARAVETQGTIDTSADVDAPVSVSARPRKGRLRRQSVIAWASVGVAVGLLAVAARDLFFAPHPTASQPVQLRASTTPVAAATAPVGLAEPARAPGVEPASARPPVATTTTVGTAGSAPAPSPAAPVAQPPSKPITAPADPPARPRAKPKRKPASSSPKSGKGDDPFGI